MEERTIKFRAWDKKHKSFLNDEYYYLISLDGGFYSYSLGSLTREAVEDIVLMQSTGLKDRNGKEIFEGDIVKDTSDSDLVFTVKWDSDKAGYYMPAEYDEEYAYSLSQPELEVIGNIHENPELINKPLNK